MGRHNFPCVLAMAQKGRARLVDVAVEPLDGQSSLQASLRAPERRPGYSLKSLGIYDHIIRLNRYVKTSTLIFHEQIFALLIFNQARAPCLVEDVAHVGRSIDWVLWELPIAKLMLFQRKSSELRTTRSGCFNLRHSVAHYAQFLRVWSKRRITQSIETQCILSQACLKCLEPWLLPIIIGFQACLGFLEPRHHFHKWACLLGMSWA